MEILKNKKIDTLEALRTLAFLGVFLAHTGINTFKSLGYWGVSVFLILSGFLMIYSYREKDISFVSIKESIKFAYGKLKYIYPLHILTMLAMIPFEIFGEKTNSLTSVIISVVLDSLLIQDWFPLKLRSLNGSSWYLCTLFFFYLIFPCVLKYFKNRCNLKKAVKNIIILIAFKVLICIIGRFLLNVNIDNELLVSDWTYWFVYHFPISRIIEILIGCNLGYLFINRSNVIEINANLLEIVIIIIVLSSIYLSYLFIPTITMNGSIGSNNNRWWNNSLVFILPNIFLVLIFAYGEGKISKLISNKITLYLAKISKPAFLIHDDVFSYLTTILYRLPYIGGIELYFNYGGIIKLTVGFLLTIFCCEIWFRIENILKTK